MNCKKILIVILYLFNSITSWSNDNKFCINQYDPNLDKVLINAKFEKGIIYLKNDSIEANLLVYKRRNIVNAYLYCIFKLNNDSIKIYTAKEIEGYRIKNDYYIKHFSDGNYFFIHKVKSGKVDLFEREGIPLDKRFLYYLKISQFDNYIVINPSEDNITVNNLPNTNQSESSGSTIVQYRSKGINQKFKKFISTYLGDCEKLRNMVNSEFYTINDIPNIIGIYNNCGNVK